MAALPYDPGLELMRMGAQLLATEAGNMDTQAGPPCSASTSPSSVLALQHGLLSLLCAQSAQLMMDGAAGGWPH